ncbi:hypothetical protein BOX37_08555 [Nocardia mangyaensis]|uniref:PE domain-containing protein n=1 Tax=Nocardia mangyaensis TaxID=2213200 RepID=A0A1J0VPS4_9NOCA|nr:hypothetical protein [Nocardia mangyaensis]APE34014.1 hypothetical protein BOX37_08555 [Nocardia mangyaensis]
MAEKVNYGEADITAFTQRASAGEFSFEPDAVRAAVKEIDSYIHELIVSRGKIASGESASGFGTLPSGMELQLGFQNKARSAGSAINQLIEGAMQIQEGFLRSAGLIEDADSVSARRIALMASTVEGPQ